MVEGWGREHSGGNAEEKVLARSDLLFAGGGVLPEAGVFLRGLSKTCARCLKEFDLQLKRLPSFLHYFAQRCVFPQGKSRELVSRFKKRVDMFLGCLYKWHEGRMSITTVLCEVQKYYIIVLEFLTACTPRCTCTAKWCNELESRQN